MSGNCCANCYYCRNLYTKAVNRFEKQKPLFCCKHKKVINKTESCENWSVFSNRRKEVRKQVELDLAITAIDNMQKNLSEIRQILSEK